MAESEPPLADQPVSTADYDLRRSVRSTAHDLNNAIGALRLATDLLDQDLADTTDVVAMIRQQVQELAGLVGDLRRTADGG